jgi:hypothetical protein
LSTTPTSFLLLIRRLHCLSDEDLRRLLQRVFHTSIFISLAIVAVMVAKAVVLLLGLDFLDAGDSNSDIVDEWDSLEVYLFAERRDKLI